MQPPESFLELTKSICPLCTKVLDAQIVAREGRIVLRKRCPDHGTFEALLSSDAARYMETLRYNKPGTQPRVHHTAVSQGCPLDCGLCPDHKQHACLAVIEVNSNCNLDCPICFADSGTGGDSFSLSIEQVTVALDTLLEAEEDPEVVMFSGGEPTLHPDLLTFVTMAKDRGVQHVLVNTNGLRLAADHELVRELAERGASIYLQFDGLSAATSEALRGRDLGDLKRRALDRCAEHGLRVALVAAVERDVNEGELGDIVRFGLEHPAVNAVVFQPTTHTGRHRRFDPLDRVTNDEVVALLSAQVPDLLLPTDLVPVPCCFPTCRSVTYLVKIDGEYIPVPRLVDVDAHLDYITNRVFPDESIQIALEHLWSASAVVGTDSTTTQLACATCAVEVPPRLEELSSDAFMIVIQDFQDAYTLNVRQLMKCCIVQATPDGRLIPFCAYNAVGYREEVRASLTGVSDPVAVPNATELAAAIETGPHGSMIAQGIASIVSLLEEDVKACCAAFYGSDLVEILLGPSYHPGGMLGTTWLLDGCAIDEDDVVLDVACGTGATARGVSQDHGCSVIGLDLSEQNVAIASERAQAVPGSRMHFLQGDAGQIPLADESVSVVLCECALCLFPDPPSALAEINRVLRPGGRLGLADVTVDRGRLPASLVSLGASVACIGRALGTKELDDAVSAAGFSIRDALDETDSVRDLIARVDARLRLASVHAADALARVDVASIFAALGDAERCARGGSISYRSLIALRGNGSRQREDRDG